MRVEIFYDKKRTKTASFVVTDEKTKYCAIIDPVLDYDQNSGSTYTESADKLVKFVEINNLKVQWILETHVHADHLTSSRYIQAKIGGKVAIGYNVTKVLQYWSKVFDDKEMLTDGSQFDHLFKENDTFKIGGLEAKVIFTPGHTPACASYLINGSIFTGDTIFSPEVGTSRTDFPGGSSEELFDSVQKIYSLPDETIIYVGHEYPKNPKKPVISTTVGEEKKKNISINASTKKEDYVFRMANKQVNLPVPQLIIPSLHVNLLGGRLPKFIKVPVNVLGGSQAGNNGSGQCSA